MQTMLKPIAFFISFTIFATQGIGGISHPPAEPKHIIVKDLLHKITLHGAIALFGREHLIDSSLSDVTDRSNGEQGTSSKHNLKQFVFAPVTFEGVSAKVTVFFNGDSSFKTTVSIPYPLKLRAGATLDDFHKLGARIETSVGKPTVSTEMYIDYMKNGTQYLFGKLKDGLITIDITPGH
jgi:hypothetical protein